MSKTTTMLVAVAVAMLGAGCGASATAKTEVVDASALVSMRSYAAAPQADTIMPGDFEVTVRASDVAAPKPLVAAPMALSHEVASKRGVLMYGSVGGVGVSE